MPHTVRHTGLSILLVEDDPNDQQLFELALQTASIPVPMRALKSGAEALRYLKGLGLYADRSLFPYPSFLITDLKMPQGSGFCILEYLHQNPDFQIIPTLILSASSDPDDVRRAYNLGASAFLKKPTSFNELTRILKCFYEFWIECETPLADPSGRILPTDSTAKLGEGFER